MKPSFTYIVRCPCGWRYGPSLKVAVDEYTRSHRASCDLWAAR